MSAWRNAKTPRVGPDDTGLAGQVCSETVAAKRAVNQWMNPAALTNFMRTKLTESTRLLTGRTCAWDTWFDSKGALTYLHQTIPARTGDKGPGIGHCDRNAARIGCASGTNGTVKPEIRTGSGVFNFAEFAPYSGRLKSLYGVPNGREVQILQLSVSPTTRANDL